MDSCLRHGQDRKIRGVWRWWVWRWLRSCLLAMFAVSSFKFGTCWTVGLGECFSMETEKLLLGIVSINICYENQLMFLSECSQKLFARHACSFKCECFWRVEISWADGFIFRTECWILLDLHYLHLFTPFDLAAPATARMWRMCLSTCGRQFRSTWLRQDLAGPGRTNGFESCAVGCRSGLEADEGCYRRVFPCLLKYNEIRGIGMDCHGFIGCAENSLKNISIHFNTSAFNIQPSHSCKMLQVASLGFLRSPRRASRHRQQWPQIWGDG